MLLHFNYFNKNSFKLTITKTKSWKHKLKQKSIPTENPVEWKGIKTSLNKDTTWHETTEQDNTRVEISTEYWHDIYFILFVSLTRNCQDTFYQKVQNHSNGTQNEAKDTHYFFLIWFHNSHRLVGAFFPRLDSCGCKRRFSFLLLFLEFYFITFSFPSLLHNQKN